MFHNSMWLGPALLTLIPFAFVNHIHHAIDTCNVYPGVVPTIKHIDRICTHAIAFKTVWDSCASIVGTTPPRHQCSLSIFAYQVSLFYSIGAFYVLKPAMRTASSAQIVHASIHIISALGLCAYVHSMHAAHHGSRCM